MLWEQNTTEGLEGYADQLQADVNELNARIAKLTFPPEVVVGGAAALMEEVAATKISGEEDRYSRTDLWDFQANFDGSEKIFELLKPIVEKQDPAFVKKVQGNFDEVDATLAKYKTAHGFESYEKLTDSDRALLASRVNTLAEDLSTLRGKLGAESDEVRSRVALLEGDYETLEPGGPIGAVLWPFNAMHHCAGPDAVVAVLRAALGWVKPRGLLALDCYLPDLDLYDRDPEARFEPRAFRDPRSGQPMESWEQGWWDADAHVHHVLYVYRHPDGREERTRLQLRMYPLAEVRRMLAVAGWELEHESRDFSGAPLEEDALKYVAIARRR